VNLLVIYVRDEFDDVVECDFGLAVTVHTLQHVEQCQIVIVFGILLHAEIYTVVFEHWDREMFEFIIMPSPDVVQK